MYDNKTIIEVNVSDIIEPTDPMRSEIDHEKIVELAESIKKQGLINPVTVRPVHVPVASAECVFDLENADCKNPLHIKYEIVAGHRRFKACLYAGLYMVPAVVREMTDDAVFSMRAHENLFRDDVDPVDEALYIGKIIGEDETKIAEVANMLNRSTAWVEDRLAILTYPDYFLPNIKTGRVKLGVAKALAEIGDEVYRKMFFDNALRDGMTVWQAEYYLSQWKNGVFKNSNEIIPPDGNPRRTEVIRIRQECVRCGRMAETPNLQSVFVHIECPPDSDTLLAE